MFMTGSITKEWYDHLKQGKLMGLKCKRCGNIDCPPFPVCNSCSGTNIEWVELSREGVLTTFSFAAMGVTPFTPDPVFVGFVTLKDGVKFMSVIEDEIDDDEDEQQAFLEKLPLPVVVEIKDLDENTSYPVFRISK